MMKGKLFAVKKTADKILDYFAVVLFTGIFLAVMLQVVLRAFFNYPLVWSEELARYLFMWISLIGWVFATRSGTHIRIAIVADNLPVKVQKAINFINFLLTVIFAGIMFYYGAILVGKNMDVPTITLFFTYAAVYAAVPFTMVFLVFYSVYGLVSGQKSVEGALS
jgi:TRAP-type C4-dicarboxylate transport system permease small subunit